MHARDRINPAILYLGDYLGDTLDFTADQHAVFQKLLVYLWISGPCGLKDKPLRKAAEVPRSEWRDLRGLLLPPLEAALRGITKWKEAVGAYDGQRLPASEWQVIRAIVLTRDDYTCAYCGSESDLHVDHRIPVSRGGSNCLGNLVTACGPCNQSKGPKLLDAWRP